MLRNLVGNTPLIELSSGILVKLETYNPTGSIKDRIISYIVRKAVESRDIKPGMTLVEATSGNTGIALSAMGSHIGHKVKIVMPSNMSEERKQMMRLFGAEIIEVEPHNFKGAIALRDQMVKEGCWSPNQFANELNIECHFKTTAKEIYNQLRTRGETWGAFISGAGTGGTMMGIQKYVKWRGLDTQLVFMKPAEKEHGIQDIDLVIVNLYPFEDTINSNSNDEICIENIDIGGPAMLRSAAKNHQFVTVVSDTDDYEDIISELDKNGGSTTLGFRKKLAAKTYTTTAQYDTLISNWFLKDSNELKINFSSPANLSSELRYGENPHQSAGIYKSSFQKSGIPYADLIQGKELSYNNINDADAALQLIKEFDTKESAVAIIKHANPCGVACGKSLIDAYEKAFSCDTTSAFGGIIAVNQTLDEETAQKIIEVFTEVIIVPEITEGAKKVLQEKNNIRVLVINNMRDNKVHHSFKSIEGGVLVQSGDDKETKDSDLKIVTKIQPTKEQRSDMLFAFKVCKHVKSNAIIYVKNKKTIGIGAGQMSRVDSARIASQKNS